MLTLVRGIHFTIDHAHGDRLVFGSPGSVSLSQTPLTLWLTVGGYFDPASGFVVNVCDIDDIIRDELKRSSPEIDSLEDLFSWIRSTLREALPDVSVYSLRADLHENLRLEQSAGKETMVQLTRKYEIAAAHQLLNPDWDEARNQAVFGKCNNTAGHGHNYTLEVTVTGAPDADSGNVIDPEYLDAVVKETILERFDHKFLNKETEEFRRLNPTVENMVMVFWDLLVDRCQPASLAKIGIWETPRTYAEYTGPPTTG